MKTTLTTILASIALALTAAASPSVRIDMTVATSGGRIMHRPVLVAQSGKQATISTGRQEPGRQESVFTIALTPTLLDNGAVDIQTAIMQREGKKVDRHATRIVVLLGKFAKFKVGELVVTAKPTLASKPVY